MNSNYGNRKIQTVRYSFLIPLPVEWINSMRLGKGDPLKINMQDDHSLKIAPVPQSGQGSKGTGTPTATTVQRRSAGNEG